MKTSRHNAIERVNKTNSRSIETDLIMELYEENSNLRAVNKEVVRINWSLTWILFIFVIIVLASSFYHSL